MFLILVLLSTSLPITLQKQKFQVQHQWHSLNFTWESPQHYQEAITAKKYIPGNSVPAGIKHHEDKIYIAMPRVCEGTPVTLGYIQKNSSSVDPLITPFPDWYTNDLSQDSCDKLENVQSMEIDPEGVMWVLDGFRLNPQSKCPPKLVLYDLSNSKRLHTFTFPKEVCLSKGGFLNDLVIDTSDGGFAYITDNSDVDPGLIVYSRKKNKAWKLRDASMFGEIDGTNFCVGGSKFTKLAPIDGIALAPKQHMVYYCPLAGLGLYSLKTELLKKEEVSLDAHWRFNVTKIGKKPAQSDGMMIDDVGNLYYGLLPLYGVGTWDTKSKFSTAKIVDMNNETMIWTDSFSFDNEGYLHMLTNNIHLFFMTRCTFHKNSEILFRIFKYHTGQRSYLYSV